jgi:hypothetical protein
MAQNLTEFVYNIPLDPYKQPAFFVPNASGYPGYGALIYDHYLNIIGRITNNENSYMNVDGYTDSGGTEFSNNWGYSGGNPGSGGGYSNHHTSQNYLGHTHFEVSTSPFLNGALVHSNRADSTPSRSPWRFLCNIVRDDNHDTIMLVDTSNTFVIAPKYSPKMAGWMFNSNSTYYTDFRSNVATYAPSLLTSGHSMVEGGISYNAQTRTAVFMERTGYSHRPIVVTNVNPPRDYIYKAKDWLIHIEARITAGGKYTISTYQDKPTNQSSEDQLRGVPMLCDDGTIYYFQMVHSWGYTVAEWVFDGTTINIPNFNGNGARLHSNSWTTSYGIADNQSIGGGSTWNITNDGTKIFAYCNSYYYHCGFWGVWVDLPTGRIIYNYYRQDGSHSTPIVPIQKDKFITNFPENSDGGRGLRASLMEYEQEWSYAGRNGTNSKRRNMSDSPFWQYQEYWLNSPYHSTHYTQVTPMDYDKTSVGRARY